MSISSCPFTGYHCVESGSVFCVLSCHIFICIDNSPWDFFLGHIFPWTHRCQLIEKKVCCSWSECKFHVSEPADLLIQQLRRSPKIVLLYCEFLNLYHLVTATNMFRVSTLMSNKIIHLLFCFVSDIKEQCSLCNSKGQEGNNM